MGEGGCDVRTVLDVDLFEVAVVTHSAYPPPNSAMRSHNCWRQAKSSDVAAKLREMRLKLERVAMEALRLGCK